jgi:hypothetical protein
MPITTLTNHSINPAGAGSNTGMLMPKLKYRFRVTLLGFGTETSTELTKQVMDVTRPKVSFEEIPIEIYNSKIKLAGKYTWENVTLTIRDDVSSNVIKLVGQQIQKQFDFHEQASARAGVDYKFTMRIEVLDGGNGAATPQVLETWQLYGCFLQNTDYGDLNYATNEPATVALTIVYDSADNTPDAVGVIGVGTAGAARPTAIDALAVGSGATS